jgi:hypothetical protein
MNIDAIMRRRARVETIDRLIFTVVVSAFFGLMIYAGSVVQQDHLPPAPSCPAPAYNTQEKLYHWNRASELEIEGRYPEAIVELHKTLCIDPSDEFIKEELRDVESEAQKAGRNAKAR